MKKTFASVLTALAMVLALLLPMSAFALDADLSDDVYAVDYTLTGDGTMKMVEPATLVVKDGKAYARLAWNDPEVDKLYVGEDTYLPVDFTKSHNIQGKLPVFEVPLEAYGEDLAFQVHSRGVNLDLDDYVLNMKEYDPDFDATELNASVAEGIRGAQPVKFYKWSTGKASSLWGPFALLAAVAVAIVVWDKRQKD